jgi:hypothetical protein
MSAMGTGNAPPIGSALPIKSSTEQKRDTPPTTSEAKALFLTVPPFCSLE